VRVCILPSAPRSVTASWGVVLAATSSSSPASSSSSGRRHPEGGSDLWTLAVETYPGSTCWLAVVLFRSSSTTLRANFLLGKRSYSLQFMCIPHGARKPGCWGCFSVSRLWIFLVPIFCPPFCFVPVFMDFHWRSSSLRARGRGSAVSKRKWFIELTASSEFCRVKSQDNDAASSLRKRTSQPSSTLLRLFHNPNISHYIGKTALVYNKMILYGLYAYSKTTFELFIPLTRK